MLIVEKITIIRREIRRWRDEGKHIAFVPTMGSLHEGHLKLVKEAQKIADRVVVSIFVNPMQFNDPKEFEKYPRIIQKDCEKLELRNVDMVFSPSVATIYPNGLQRQTYVEVSELSNIFEGANRPGHFRGVATVACKLFNIVQPDVVLLGEKDFQQVQLIRKMVTDLAMDIAIVSVPTVRAKNGLALSSRNALLSSEDLQIAPQLYQVMKNIGGKLISGQRNIERILAEASIQLRDAGFRPDQLFIRDASTLRPLTDHSEHAIILMAAFLGQTRLIDNLQVDLMS